LYDDPLVFIIILHAKARSLVTNDEAGNFVIESTRSRMKIVIITSESSWMNTFLVVGVRAELAICTRSVWWRSGADKVALADAGEVHVQTKASTGKRRSRAAASWTTQPS
jgi:hypothetical protein